MQYDTVVEKLNRITATNTGASRIYVKEALKWIDTVPVYRNFATL